MRTMTIHLIVITGYSDSRCIIKEYRYRSIQFCSNFF